MTQQSAMTRSTDRIFIAGLLLAAIGIVGAVALILLADPTQQSRWLLQAAQMRLQQAEAVAADSATRAQELRATKAILLEALYKTPWRVDVWDTMKTVLAQEPDKTNSALSAQAGLIASTLRTNRANHAP